MKISDNQAIIKVVTACLIYNVKQATIYISPKFRIRATRRFKPDKHSYHEEILLILGKPNHKEREFIKKCKIVKEPFPVKKMQLKWYKPATK